MNTERSQSLVPVLQTDRQFSSIAAARGRVCEKTRLPDHCLLAGHVDFQTELSLQTQHGGVCTGGLAKCCVFTAGRRARWVPANCPQPARSLPAVKTQHFAARQV